MADIDWKDLAKMSKELAKFYCCKVGVPCDCNKPAGGQNCERKAHAACCALGIQCSGDGPNPNQCGQEAYAYCCDIGTTCDCTKSKNASNQCGSKAYAYCCDIGTPCKCK